jgi:hypothetical protein
VNYHGYLDTLEPLKHLANRVYATPREKVSWYDTGEVRPFAFPKIPISRLDKEIELTLNAADEGFRFKNALSLPDSSQMYMLYEILRAHELWRTLPPPARFEEAAKVLTALERTDNVDFVRAAWEWIDRRRVKWTFKGDEKRYRRSLLCPNCGNKDDDDVADPNGPVPSCSNECGYAMQVQSVEELK